MRRMWAASVMAALAVCPLLAFGEAIELKDGSKIEGKIKAKNATEILVDVEGIEVKVNGDEVKAIDGLPYSCDYKALYQQRADETPPMDIEGRFALAMWCKEHGLKEQMNVEIERILTLSPGHEGANKELGRLFVRGQWRTPDELKKIGFVKKNGEWMTPDEASQAEGKVQYRGNWLRPGDAKYIEARQFSKTTSACRKPLDMSTGVPTTFNIVEMQEQIRRIELLNMWKPTQDQLKKMWKILNEAEADRQMFVAKIHKIAPEVEASWIALRNEALKGVVDSFDQDPEVERRAGTSGGICGAIKKGAHMRLYNAHAEKFLAVLGPAQKDVFFGKYCAMCHSTALMKGGVGKEIRGTQAGVDFLEKVRALPEDQFNTQKCDLAQEALKKFGKGPQTLLGKKAQRVGKRSNQDMDAEEMTICDIMTRSRLATETEWGRRRFNYAAEVEGTNQEERLRAIAVNGSKEKGQFLTDIAAHGMIADALFDGSLREVVAMKLGIPKEQMVVKASADANVIPEFKDGATAFQEMCTTCHTLDRINKAIKSPVGWRETVEKRLRQGVSDDPKLIEMITEYLVNRGQQKAEAK